VDFLVKKEGETYKCDECGLVIEVRSGCGCDESCELVCCQQPMTQVSEEEEAQKAPEK
jgi:hypothetical protein